MARLHAGIIALCLFAFICTAHADIGTVRLLEDHLLFASPATATDKPDQFVKVICSQDETTSSRTVTSDPLRPLIRASAGENITILNVLRCADTNNGAYVQARTVQHMVGYTQLPNYPAISGDLLSAVISTRCILGFRKDNPNVFSMLVQNSPITSGIKCICY